MQFNSVRRNNNAGAAQAVVAEAQRLYEEGRASSNDITGIVKTSIQGRSAERQANTRGEANVAQAAIKGMEQIGTTKVVEKAKADVRKIKGSAKRMAGIVGGLGSLAVAGITMGQQKDEPTTPRSDGGMQALMQQSLQRSQQAIQNLQDQITNFKPTEVKPFKSDTGSTSTSDSSSTADSPGAVDSNISAQHSANPEGVMSKDEITRIATSVGFSPENAKLVVGIAGGESGYDPSNSTERSGLKARTGEDSVGLMQINWGYHKDSGWLQELGITKREDLFDPVKNMKAAKYLFDGRGNFGDWTVYNKGIYKRYM